MIPLLLYLLATVDAAFCGYRAAAGRSALIYKRRYYRRAMLWGALYGQAAVLIAGAASLAFVLFSSDRAGLIDDLYGAGERMLFVYLPYAVIIFLAFALRQLPSVDVRSLMSVLIFGPLSLLRPLVAVAGVAWGVAAVRRASVLTLGLLLLFLMLSLERFLGWRKVYEPIGEEVA